MGNEVSEMATDAAVDALVDGIDIDANVDLDVNVDSGAVEEAVDELQRSFGTFQLDEADADDYNYYEEDEYYDDDPENYEQPEEEYGYADEEDYDEFEDEYEYVEEDQEEYSDGAESEEYEDLYEDEVEDDPSGGYADDVDAWDDVEIGETEDGLFDEDISVLRTDASLLGDNGLDIYEGIEPMEPFDWESDEFFTYDFNELSTVTDMELTSLGYPPEPIFGTSTEDILFSVDMLEESTVPPATYSAEMVESAQELADVGWDMADSIGELRQSLL